MSIRQYSIGKPGFDDDRQWSDLKESLKRSEVEKIEISAGGDVPDHRKEAARRFSESAPSIVESDA